MLEIRSGFREAVGAMLIGALFAIVLVGALLWRAGAF
jgi:hypothetical protein